MRYTHTPNIISERLRRALIWITSDGYSHVLAGMSEESMAIRGARYTAVLSYRTKTG